MKINSITTLSATFIAATFALGQPADSEAAIYVKIPGVPGDVAATDTQHTTNWNWIVIDSYTHELNRDSETGEISEIVRIKRQTDEDSQALLQAMLDGTEFPELLIGSVETDTDGEPVCYLKYKLERCFVKSWSTSGDADDRPTEEVAFYYNKIAFSNAQTADSFSFGVEREMKESGEKGGTADINIGIGELQETATTTGDANLDGTYIAASEPVAIGLLLPAVQAAR